MRVRMRVLAPVVVVACVIGGLVLGGCLGGGDSDSDDGGAGTSAAGTGDGPSGTLVASWDAAPENWAPGTDNIDGFMRIPYETLIQRTPESPTEFEPMLATDWELTDDSMTLELRDDVVFHDGTPFNAEAVKTNIEYVQDQGGPFSPYIESIEEVEVIDDNTVELHLSEPDPALEASLASRAGLMGSPAAIEDGSIEQAPVGTGPWQYSEADSDPGTRWVFDYFPDYYDPSQAKVERIELVATDDPAARFAAIRTGEVDIGEHDAAQIAQAEGAGLSTETVPGTHIALFMQDRGPGGQLEDVETRRGVCSGIDTQEFGQVGGEGARVMMTQRFGEGDYGHNPEIEGWDLDPDQAKAAEDADLAIGIFDAVASDAEAIAGQLEEQGISLDVELVPANDYFANWYKNWEVGIGDNTEVHPYQWYKTWFAADAPNNASGVESKELKAAADEAIAAGSSPEAEELWQEVMKIIDDEALVCLHQDFNFAAAWNSDRVSNVVLYPYMIGFVDYRQIEVTE